MQADKHVSKRLFGERSAATPAQSSLPKKLSPPKKRKIKAVRSAKKKKKLLKRKRSSSVPPLAAAPPPQASRRLDSIYLQWYLKQPKLRKLSGSRLVDALDNEVAHYKGFKKPACRALKAKFRAAINIVLTPDKAASYDSVTCPKRLRDAWVDIVKRAASKVRRECAAQDLSFDSSSLVGSFLQSLPSEPSPRRSHPRGENSRRSSSSAFAASESSASDTDASDSGDSVSSSDESACDRAEVSDPFSDPSCDAHISNLKKMRKVEVSCSNCTLHTRL